MKTIIKQISKIRVAGFILMGATALCFAFIPVSNKKLTNSISGPDKWIAPPEADKKINPVASNEGSIAAGKSIYTKTCNDCHGKKGKGDGPKNAELDVAPKDFTKEEFQKQSDGSLFWKITEGKKPMPSFKKDITEEQRWQVINYIRTLGNGDSKKK